MNSVHVDIDRASKVYRSRRDDIEAIREVSLQINYGEFVSLLGPSGCGKSTLLMAIGGLLPITGGAIRIGGEVVREPRREIGIVFQAPVLMPWRTVLNNILFPVENLRLPMGPARDRARALLEMTGSPSSPDIIPGSSRGACSSGRPSAAPSFTTRRSYSWTSRSAPWMP